MQSFDARFVSSVQLTGGASPELRRIEFARPDPAFDRGTVNILCGPNNSGKTYLLRRIRETLTGAACRVANPPEIVLTKGRDPRVAFSDRLWRDKTKVGTAASSASQGTPGDVPDLKALTTALGHRVAAPHLNGALSLEQWNERKNRIDWFKGHRLGKPRDGMILRCDATDPVVREVEQILGGTLYLRLDGEGRVDFALMQAERDVLPFEQWSEGQKSILAIVAFVSEAAPDVFLIDEIENHFHPGYMSAVMRWLRSRVPQTIVASHHPHIIFSEFVDHAVFLELRRGGRARFEPPAAEAYQKHDHSPAPHWTATSIRDDFAKIAESYKLFDHGFRTRRTAQIMRTGQIRREHPRNQVPGARHRLTCNGRRSQRAGHVPRATGGSNPQTKEEGRAPARRGASRPSCRTYAEEIADLQQGAT